jgi:hypothetical protein
MLHALVLAAVALSASPSPSPSPGATATPAALRVIVTVHSSTACAEILSHANAAIASALANDTSLAAAIKALQAVELDGNVIEHRNGLVDLGNYAKKINLEALAGDAEIKRLRKLAADSTDPQRKKELKAFADWLGGAIWRQRKVARDLNGFVATMDFYDMSTLDESQMNMDVALFGSPDTQPVSIAEASPTGIKARTIFGGAAGGPVAPPREQRPTYDSMAKAAGADFTLRLPAIANHESMAASHVGQALGGCQ